MKGDPILAAFWFYEIWKRDKQFAGQIIGKFRVRELRKLTKMIPKIDPLSRELKNKFSREISEIFLNKNQFPKTGSKVLLTGSFNYFFIIFSLIICLILLWIKIFSLSIENNLLKPGQEIWLTAMGLSILLPFFLSLAIKNKYFSKNRTVLQSLFSIFTSALLLIGLMSILNYLSVSTNAVAPQKGFMVVMIIFFVSLLGPWIEEVLFRGLLFDQVISFFHKKDLDVTFPLLNSRDSLSLNSIIWAFVLTSITFAFIHKWESPSGFFIYFLCGIILSWQRYQSGCLWNSWISHAIANGVIVFS